MNLFTARLTGKMLSAEAFEKTIHDMQERVKRYRTGGVPKIEKNRGEFGLPGKEERTYQS